eukprot:symbB.v1.2.007959.t1/scaffold478.1/size396144/10
MGPFRPFPASPRGQREADQYELIMVMRRSFRRHFFTFFILSMAVLKAFSDVALPTGISATPAMWGPLIFVVLLAMLMALAVMLLSEIKGLREVLRQGWSTPVKTWICKQV